MALVPLSFFRSTHSTTSFPTPTPSPFLILPVQNTKVGKLLLITFKAHECYFQLFIIHHHQRFFAQQPWSGALSPEEVQRLTFPNHILLLVLINFKFWYPPSPVNSYLIPNGLFCVIIHNPSHSSSRSFVSPSPIVLLSPSNDQPNNNYNSSCCCNQQWLISHHQ